MKMKKGGMQSVSKAMGKSHDMPKLKATTHSTKGKKAPANLTHGPSSKKKS